MARTGLLVLKNLQSVTAISSLLSQSRAHIQSKLFVQPNYEQLEIGDDYLSRAILDVISEIYARV